jgi:signal transduction histidine kinase
MSDPSTEIDLAELIAVMAHDLNNPLAALVTNLSFIESALPADVGLDAVEALSDAVMLCDVLRRLVSNLDLIARREGISSMPVVVDLAPLVQQSVDRMRKQAAAAEVELVLEPPQGGVLSRCDRELFARALDNVIAYALELAPARTTIRVSAVTHGQERRFFVRHQRRAEAARPLPPPVTRADRRRRAQVLHGRGAALLCARIAAGLAGGRLEQAVFDGDQAELCLVAPGDKER